MNELLSPIGPDSRAHGAKGSLSLAPISNKHIKAQRRAMFSDSTNDILMQLEKGN